MRKRDVLSKLIQDVICVLRNGQPLDEPARERLACLLEIVNPAHRPRHWTVPYNNRAILDLVFGFMQNHDLVEKLRAGKMPRNDEEFDQQYANAAIKALAPQSAKNANQAFTMAVDWFARRGIKMTKNKVSKLFHATLQDYASTRIDTPAKWEDFKKSEAEKQLLK
jgi:hypothetical protein